jgi:hypothetical protein
MTSATTDAPTAQRRPYYGSCHCGAIQYIAFLALPLSRVENHSRAHFINHPTLRVRRCNCTACHKFGFLQILLPHAPADFMLLAPLDLEELGDYRCFGGDIRWLFCKTCAVRCFSLVGDGELLEREVPEVRIPGRMEEGREVPERIVGGHTAMVWVPKKGWKDGEGQHILSVNAHTLEAKQEGLDLREWREKGLICYLDTLDEREDASYERPHIGGTY